MFSTVYSPLYSQIAVLGCRCSRDSLAAFDARGTTSSLVKLAQEESVEATSVSDKISEVCERHHESLVAFLRFKLKSKAEADDIAQETYARVLRRGKIDDVKCLRSYVFKTANNLAINKLVERTRKRMDLTVDPQEIDLPGNEATPEEHVQYQEKLRVITDAIRELPEKCRMAFVMYKFEFVEYKEIASRMKLTESMIRKYVLKGMRHCQSRLEEQRQAAVGQDADEA